MVIVAVAPVVIVAVAFVALTLRQPNVETFAPTTPAPRDAGAGLVGPVVYTVDATDPEQWRHFSFRVGAVVDERSGTEWDLAFRRYQVIANGGPSYQGTGGIVDLGEVGFDGVRTLPATGYQVTETRPDPHNPAIAGWYTYGFFSHVLSPKPRVWGVRTADGRYAKIEIVSYYCPGARPGCVTFRYVYQGDGSLSVGRITALR
jgi:hypothetical protein